MGDLDVQQSDQDSEADEADLWFLPALDCEDEDVPPGSVPKRSDPYAPLFDQKLWKRAQAALARELAEVAEIFGALDLRLRTGPEGWRQRLALREVADLSWWVGDHLGTDRIALWVMLRIGSTDDIEGALARAGWAARRLSAGPGPAEDLSGFLERAPRGAKPDTDENALLDLGEVLAEGGELHPIVAAARLFHAWKVLGSSHASDFEAAVLAARHAATMSRAVGQGALFLPLVQTGSTALRGQGDPESKLSAWLRGAAQASLAALLHLDRVEAWRSRSQNTIDGLSGRTPPRLLDVLEALPYVSAHLAEAKTGASRAAIQRNLAYFEKAGLVQEVTGQERYRVWRIAL